MNKKLIRNVSFTLLPVLIGFAVAYFLLTQSESPESTAPSNNTVAFGEKDLVIPPQANIFVELAKKVVPSVVNISTFSTAQAPPGGMGEDPFRDFWEFFFRDQQGSPFPKEPRKGKPRPAPKTRSLGSGFIIDEAGLILTNNHVVSNAEEIKIHFTEDPDEKPTDGKVVGRDPELDLVLIQVKTDRKLVPLPLGDSEKVEVGEYVVAVGNPFGQGHTVTHGIISAKGRDAPDFPLARYFQTDAPINPGNSGGPLITLRGEVIGINNAIDARAQGIGFAIPISLVKKVLPQLKTKGKVSRGYIGVLVNPITPEIAEKIGVSKEIQAPFVAQVFPGQPADQAGLKNYDVITEVNGKEVKNPAQLIKEITSVEVGKKVKIKVLRGKKTLDLEIKVAERPASDEVVQEREQNQKKEKRKSDVDTGMELDNLNDRLAGELGIPAGEKGVVVIDLSYDGPAVRAGIRRGDVILEVDRKKINNVRQFDAIVKQEKSYLLRVKRFTPSGEVFAVVILDLKE